MAAYAEDDNIPVTPDNIVQGAPIGLVRDNVAEGYLTQKFLNLSRKIRNWILISYVILLLISSKK